MLYLLLAGIGCLGAVSFFLFGKKVYSSVFLLCVVFFVCCLFSIVGNNLYWHEPISFLGPCIILLSLFLIVVFGYFSSHSLAFFCKKKTIETKKACAKFTLSRQAKIFLFVSFSFGLIINALFFKAVFEIAVSKGYHPFNSDFFGYVRENLNLINPRLSLANNVVNGIGIGCLYFFTYALFGLQKKKDCFFFVPCICNSLFSFFIGTGRDVFILLAVVAIVGFLVSADKKRISLKPKYIIGFICLAVFAFLFFFLLSGFVRGGSTGAYTTTVLNTLCIYAGSPIVAFDKWLRQVPALPRNDVFGEESFSGVLYLINKFFPNSVPQGTYILEYTPFINGIGTNIYTMFRSFVADFGIAGDLLLSALIGISYGIVFHFQIKARERSPFLLYSAIVTFYLLYGAFTPNVTNSLFGASRLMILFFSLGFYEGLRFLIFGRSDFPFLERVAMFNSKFSFKKNVTFAIVSEAIVLVAGAAASFLLPKFIGESSFNYYQLFSFYIGYVGLAHFGYCDGVYLRFCGKNETDLQKANLKTQFFVLAISQSCFAFFLSIASLVFLPTETERTFTLLFVGLFLIVYNLIMFVGYLFQDMNQAAIFSVSTIIAKTFFFLGLFVLFLLGVTNPFVYIGCFTLGYVVSLAYLLYKGRHFLFGKPAINKPLLSDMFCSLKLGFPLLVANFLNSLILGVSRYFIDWRWGLNAFGKLSFALSLVSLVSSFFTSFSLVLFPSLRIKNKDQVSAFFTNANTILSVLLPQSFLLFFVVFLFVRWWLPEYNDSLQYFALVLPTVIFSAKYTVIYKTSLNVDMKEKRLLLINAVAVVISTILSAISSFLLNSVVFTILSGVIGISVLGILGQFCASGQSFKDNFYSSLLDIGLSCGFMAATYFITKLWLCFLVVFSLLICFYALSPRRTWIFLKLSRSAVVERHLLRKKRSLEKGKVD